MPENVIPNIVGVKTKTDIKLKCGINNDRNCQ